MKYVGVLEKAPHNWSADVPDLPGCIATGRTRTEVERNIREAIEFHLDGMREAGEKIPEPEAATVLVEVQAQ